MESTGLNQPAVSAVPSGWSLEVTQVGGTGGANADPIIVCYSIEPGAHTVSRSGNESWTVTASCSWIIYLVEVPGLANPAADKNATFSNSGTTTAADSGVTPSTTQADEFVLAVHASKNQGRTYSGQSGGYTVASSDGTLVGTASQGIATELLWVRTSFTGPQDVTATINVGTATSGLITTAKKAGAAPTVTNITLAAGMTMTCALARQPKKTLALSTTLTSALTNFAIRPKTLAASITLTSALSRKLFKTMALATTLSPSLNRKLFFNVPLSITLTSAITRAQFKAITLQASIVNAVALVKQYTAPRLLAASVIMTPTLAKVNMKTMSVNIVCTTVMKKVVAKAMSISIVNDIVLLPQTTRYLLLEATIVFNNMLILVTDTVGKIFEHGKTEYSITGTVQHSIRGKISRYRKGRAD